jgi:glycosyltransferase involved in cell wall biosynthesis
MRIALLSTSALPVPPPKYGGTELVVADLARALTLRGHAVTVFATGDSRPAADLRAHFAAPVWPPDDTAELRHVAYAWKDIGAREVPFDVVHVHQAPALAFSLICPVPTVLTFHHERCDKLVAYYADFPDANYVAISRRQAELIPEVAVTAVVHHGLDVERYEPGDGAGGWIAFVGRLAAEKGPHVAIDAAVAAGIPLRMGGRPHWADHGYYAVEIEPRLERAGQLVDWQGEVSFGPKLEILRGAIVTLFPVDWEEPFGLAMIESMLVGTPVISFDRGAASEIVDEGVTGFVVRDAREMVDRIARVRMLDRARCRKHARARWSSTRMASDYEKVYLNALAPR